MWSRSSTSATGRPLDASRPILTWEGGVTGWKERGHLLHFSNRTRGMGRCRRVCSYSGQVRFWLLFSEGSEARPAVANEDREVVGAWERNQCGGAALDRRRVPWAWQHRLPSLARDPPGSCCCPPRPSLHFSPCPGQAPPPARRPPAQCSHCQAASCGSTFLLSQPGFHASFPLNTCWVVAPCHSVGETAGNQTDKNARIPAGRKNCLRVMSVVKPK